MRYFCHTKRPPMTFDLRHTALVLEGGGLRGTFTAGVLDLFMDRGIRFPYTVGVSAGATNGLSYLAGQRGRSRYGNIELQHERPYIGWRHWLLGHGFIDLDFLFGEYTFRRYPFDFEGYARSAERFEMVATNCLTGRAEYFEEKHDRQRLLAIGRASCSLPLLCPVARVDGVPMVDGAVSDAIPVERAMAQGFGRCVVVLTRNRGYRKPSDPRLLRLFYRRYPELRRALAERPQRYNEAAALVERLEAEGRALVVRPERPVEAGRTERDPAKLQALYDEGYACAERILPALL